MLREIAIGFATAVLALPAAPLGAETRNFQVTARVALVCQVDFRPFGAPRLGAGSVSLGEIREYCNAPQGYELVVRYQPGSMAGTVIAAGEDRVLLNGSGHAVLSRSPGPRVRTRILTAAPGERGFDTNHLDLRLQPV